MKKITLFLLAALTFVNSYAQKLPKIQTAAVRAPKAIKIDGKLTEWDDKFQAYNGGNHIYYTLSNDDDNLYFTALMEDMMGTKKILRGGITFTVISPTNKTDKAAITYPVMTWEPKTGELSKVESGPLYAYQHLKVKSANYKVTADSLIAVVNSHFMKNYKQLYITGITGVDTLTAIFNTQNILSAARFDGMMRYTYELAVPLKYLSAFITDTESLKYNISLNVLPVMERKEIPQPKGPIVELRFAGPGSIDDQFSYNNTNFSGEYTLAK